ncbi:MAG: Asp-tRNA(Asn)/Glu-tRNA(Gln) amidotransferase subunit GatC [Puniceicoccales bacterium]|nr:Asp-tRNA(Asn)/Glu-tRNA(Gln) amidotransferase subunit GatC [Puniceicoccales bacterium]
MSGRNEKNRSWPQFVGFYEKFLLKRELRPKKISPKKMAMAQTPMDIVATAEIARIALSVDERERLGDQLADILRYAAQLMAVDVEGVEPAGQPIGGEDMLAFDEVEVGFSQKDALSNAPQRERNFFSVPQVLEDAS